MQAAPTGLVATISSASMVGTIATAKILTMTLIQKSRTASKPANDRIPWLKLAKKISLLQARDARDRLAELDLQRRLEAMSAAGILAKWLKSDSAGATAWLDEMISSGKLICKSIGFRTNETCRNQMMADLTSVVIAGLLRTAPEQAIARFKSLASDQQQSLLRYNHPLRVEPGAQRGFVKLVREGMTEDQTDIVSGKHGSYPAMADEMAHAGFPQVTPN